jgi:hypothetical protein
VVEGAGYIAGGPMRNDTERTIEPGPFMFSRPYTYESIVVHNIAEHTTLPLDRFEILADPLHHLLFIQGFGEERIDERQLLRRKPCLRPA